MTVLAGRDPESTEIGIYLFAQDVLDEGADAVADRLQAAGIGRLAVAAAYHHGRDIVPHNPRRRFMYHEGGVVYFEPDRGRYGRLQPVASRFARRAPIQRLLEAARRRQMSVDAWVVSLHNSRLGARHPSSCQTPAIGGSLHHALCPANPDVRHYAQALAVDTALLGVDGIELETLCYQPFEHGSHHERSAYWLGDYAKLLLGICFCRWCLQRAAGAGVDGERLRRFVAQELNSSFEEAPRYRIPCFPNEAEVSRLCEGEMGAYLAVRRSTVLTLAEEVTAAVRQVAPRTRVTYLDPTAALLGYATGQPATGEAAVAGSWQHGISPSAIAAAVDEVGVAGYFAERSRFRREIAQYRDLGIDRIKVILRPMPPDVRSRNGLIDRVKILRDLGIYHIGFYQFGMMPLESLNWIQSATRILATPRARRTSRTGVPQKYKGSGNEP